MGRRGGLWSDKGGEIVAEFQEVMKQWGRLCTSHCVEHNDDCDGCVLGGTRADLCAAYVRDTAEGSEDIEFIVMQWAAEHPEPIYPMWIEWAVDQGILASDIPVPSNTFVAYHEGRNARKRIPADIAQKLGLEPKE